MLSDSLAETLETVVPQVMDKAVIPGASIAIVQHDTVWQQQWGVMNANTQQPVTADTRFQAASLSKPVFAFGVLQLVAANQLDLDTPLMSYLPTAQQNEDPLFNHIVNEPKLHKITARHVLCHTPGFPNWAAKEAKLKTYFMPGTRFSYSGEGYHFLQRVVEQIVQQPAAEWIQSAVLNPLNMTKASFTVTNVDASDVAVGHDKAGKAADFWEMLQMGAAYSLHCTAVEFANFLQEVLRSSAVTTLMLTLQIQVNDSTSNHKEWPNEAAPTDPQVAWGLGWGLQNDGLFWQWGDNGTFKAFAAGKVASGTAVAIFANSQNGDALWRPILEATFGCQAFPALNWLDRT